MSNKLIISAYGSHNAAVSMYYNGVYTVVEVERWLNSKNAGLTFYMAARNIQLVFDEICQYLLDQTNKSEVDVYISGYMGNIKPKFKFTNHIQCDHHVAHAAGAFYQSSYRRALVFTYDGGGDGGFFNVYLADRATGIKLLDKFNQDLGFPYMIIADYLKDIKKESLTIGNLVYAGKLMGLCSYGNVREEWLPHFDKFYETFKYSGDSFIGGAEARIKALPELFSAIGVTDFDIVSSTYEGQFAWDLAATTQRAFELQFFKYAQPYLDEHDLPVALSGGCALNVLLNTLLLDQRKGEVFVPPNTNDCGISVGALLWHIAPDNQVDLTYSGLPIMDDNRFSEYMEDGRFSLIPNADAKVIAQFIADGNIIGIVQGNSEHGSRALGNRSIICNPIAGMKDTLNHKVKNREWYRPFAPIVRVEDVHKYFNFHGTESRHMVYVAEVKDEWKAVLPAITHEDGTGRLQTLTRHQNELIYDVITEFEQMAGHGVILNTSFNVNGKPILTRLSDALHILATSRLDAVFYKGNLIFRSGEEKKHLKKLAGPLSTDLTVYLMAVGETMSVDWVGRQIKACLEGPATRVVVMVEANRAGEFSHMTNNTVSIHPVGTHRHYYEKVITALYPELTTTGKLSRYLRPLWAKEAMREHQHDSGYHICLDASVMTATTITADLTRMMTEIEAQDSEVALVSAYFNRKNMTWDRESELYYTGSCYGGRYEALEPLLTNYEGNMNWHMSIGKHCTEGDILTLCHLENTEKMKPFFV